MTYRFVDVPDCIDLTQPLMPKRGEDDDYFYGVDPAWIGEILMTWCSITNYTTYENKQEMSEYPAVSGWHNFLRSLAWNLKNVSNYNKRIFKTLPPPYKIDESDLTPFNMTEPPDDVKVGDPLRKTDISDMFDWIENNKPTYVKRYMANTTYEITSDSITHGDEGSRSWEEIGSVGNNQLYEWYWFYVYLDDDHWNISGGAWIKVERTMKITGRILKVDANWVESCHPYVEFDATWENGMYGTDYKTNRLFLPLTNCSFQQDGEDLIVTGY